MTLWNRVESWYRTSVANRIALIALAMSLAVLPLGAVALVYTASSLLIQKEEVFMRRI